MDPNVSTIGWHELATLAAMVATFCTATFFGRIPVGLSLALGSLVGAVVGGVFLPLGDLLRHLVEGMFGYFDAMLVIATATIFMFAVEKNGLLGTLTRALVLRFAGAPILLLPGIALLVMAPGMLTGSSTACVLTTGALAAPVLLHLGVPRAKAGAIIAMSAIYGMVAPPVNIPALIIGAGIDLPYVGLEVPLLVITVIPAMLCALALGLPHCRSVDRAELANAIPVSAGSRHGALLYLPLVAIAILLACERLLPGRFMLGLPLIFMIGTAIAVFTGERIPVVATAAAAIKTTLPVLGILMGVGMFIQIMTLTGARGELVIQTLRLPRGWDGLYPMIGISMPVMGAISSFGSASVLGVPFVMSLPTAPGQIVLNTAVLSLIASMGDLMPPTALVPTFAAQVVGEKSRFQVAKHCVIPALLTVLMGLLFLRFSAPLSGLLVRLGGG